MNTVRCFFRGKGPCDGWARDRAHLIPKQRLVQAGLPFDDVWDGRVWVPLCRRHHHRFDQGFLDLVEGDYPAGLRAYAEEHGFAYFGPREGWLRCS